MKKLLCLVLSLALILSLSPASKALITGTRISLCGIVDPDGADRTSWQTTAANYLESIPNSVVTRYTAFNSTQLLNYMNVANIFVVHTHGNPTTLKAIDASGTISYLTNTNISALASNALSNLDVAFLAACQTGGTALSGSNLVDAVYSKGAKCVIGYTETVDTSCNYIMVREFCVALGGEHSISQALSYADMKVLAERGTSGNTSERYIRGVTSTVYTHSAPTGEYEMLSENICSTDNIIYFINGDEVYGFFDYSKSGVDNAAVVARNSTESITENTAESYLNSICQNSQQYSLRDFYYISDTGMYVYIYNHTLCNTDTSDYVIIMLNAAGELVSYAKPREGAFDGVEVNQAMLLQAEDTLRNDYLLGAETYTIVDRQIMWDDGILSIRFSVENEENTCSEIMDYVIPLT